MFAALAANVLTVSNLRFFWGSFLNCPGHMGGAAPTPPKTLPVMHRKAVLRERDLGSEGGIVKSSPGRNAVSQPGAIPRRWPLSPH
jgi:hypothetical protein